MIYLAVGLVSFFFSLGVRKERIVFGYRKEEDGLYIGYSHIYMILSAFPAFLLSALRYGIGTDYFYSYVPQFQNVLEGTEIYFERGFYLLIKVITLFTRDYQWLFIVTSFLFTYFTYRCIFEQSKCIAVSVLLFFLSYVYFISLNNIRQSLAMAIVLYGMKYLERKQVFRFVLCVLFAGTIHQVVLIYLVFAVLDKINLSSKVLFFVSIGSYAVSKTIAPILMKPLWKIERFQFYVLNNVYTEKSVSRMLILINICFFGLLIYIEDQYSEAVNWNREYTIIKWTQCFLIMMCALDGFIPAAYRFVRIFSFVQFITVPNAIEVCESRRQRTLLYGFVLLCFCVMFLQMYLSGTEQVFPYRSVFNK